MRHRKGDRCPQFRFGTVCNVRSSFDFRDHLMTSGPNFRQRNVKSPRGSEKRGSVGDYRADLSNIIKREERLR